jgi:sortase A
LTQLRAQPIRVVLRFVASVMMVSGVLLISDAVITLAWQEPVSAYFSERDQVQLKKALIDPPKRVVEKRPLPGDAIGKIEIPSIDVSKYVVEGTDAESLRKGPGHYPDTPLPGQHGTAAIAGHRTTYGAPFRHLNDVHKGDRIILQMPYGTFVYRVERTQIVDDSALWVTKKVNHDRLVLTACHPLYSAAQRIVAFARLTERRPATVRKA